MKLPTHRRLVRRLATLTAIVGVAAAGAIGGYLGFLQVTGNFHTVVEGHFYRSAQPSSDDIAGYARRYGIRTIVNLRGANDGSPWYHAEVAASKQLGITHVNFRMTASRVLTQRAAANLIRILAEAEKPLLVHCESGADRSGLASALYLAAVANAGEEAAEAQISFRFGHISLPINPTFAMDRSFEALEPSLGFPNS